MSTRQHICGRGVRCPAKSCLFAFMLVLSLPASAPAQADRSSLAAFAGRTSPLLLSSGLLLATRRGTCRARSGAVHLQAASLRVDDFRQGSGGPRSRQGSGLGDGMAPAVPSAIPRDLPSGSLREQRDKLNQIHLEREAWYDLMKRRLRASSYQDGFQDIRRLFSQFDTNKNGALDWSEYRTLLMRVGMRPFSVTDEDIRMLFFEMGASGQGIEVRARDFFAWFSGESENGGAIAQQQSGGTTTALAMPPQAARGQSGGQAAALDDAGWTYGESVWWDEGPEMRVLKSIDLANTIGLAPTTAGGAATLASARAVESAEGVVRNDVTPLTMPSDMGTHSLDAGAGSFENLLCEVQPWTDTTHDKLRLSVYYLVNEIGLPSNKIKALAIEMPDIFAMDVDQQMRPRVDTLRAIGVPINKIAKLLETVPDILKGDSWDRRSDAIDFLGALGIPQDKVGACVVRHPRVLDLRTETMAAVVEFLVGVGRIPRAKVSKIVEAMPSLLSHSVELNLRPKLAFLTGDVGIEPEKLAALLLKFPQVLGLSVEGNLRPTVRYLTKDLGVAQEDIARILTSMPQLLGLSVEGNLKVKVEYLVSQLGVPHERLADIISKSPALLSLSVEKNLQPKVHFLVEEAGFRVEDIIKAPNVLAYSLDRMRLRHKFLSEKGLKMGLTSMMSYSTAEFQKRFDHDGVLL